MRAIARLGVMVGVLAVFFAAAEAAEPPTKRDTRGPVTVAVTLVAAEADSGSVEAKVVLEKEVGGVAERTFSWELPARR